jgi:Putative serine esterase (DUF676)
VVPAAPSLGSGSEILEPVPVIPTDAQVPQDDTLPTSAIKHSNPSPRISPIGKKGKRNAEEQPGLERIGLHILHQLPQDQIETITQDKQCPVDIVAVHGIMGDAYTTWTHSNGHFWLRDSLPEEVPGARIFSYGYPANVFFSFERGRIHDYATDLLEELLDFRKGENEKRPIIFICHSMGGIVVKKVCSYLIFPLPTTSSLTSPQAINITVVDAGRYSHIRTSTAAIFFLATPHCGSNPAKMLAVCADIITLPLTGVSRFSGKTRSDLIKSLAYGSTTLLDISNDFREHPGNMRIFSFVEQRSTPPSSEKVSNGSRSGMKCLLMNTVQIVDDISGRMFVPGEVPVPMPGCNHREVARFESKDSNGYRKIINKLKEVTSDIANSQ